MKGKIENGQFHPHLLRFHGRTTITTTRNAVAVVVAIVTSSSFVAAVAAVAVPKIEIITNVNPDSTMMMTHSSRTTNFV